MIGCFVPPAVYVLRCDRLPHLTAALFLPQTGRSQQAKFRSVFTENGSHQTNHRQPFQLRCATRHSHSLQQNISIHISLLCIYKACYTDSLRARDANSPPKRPLVRDQTRRFDNHKGDHLDDFLIVDRSIAVLLYQESGACSQWPLRRGSIHSRRRPLRNSTCDPGRAS